MKSTLLLMFIAIAMFACKKTDEASPKSLNETLLGRWSYNSIVSESYDINDRVIPSKHIEVTLKQTDYMQFNTDQTYRQVWGSMSRIGIYDIGQDFSSFTLNYGVYDVFKLITLTDNSLVFNVKTTDLTSLAPGLNIYISGYTIVTQSLKK